MGLPCMNCASVIEPEDARFFGGAFVCPLCYTLAERFQDRATSILNSLLVVTFESIRIALTEGRFHCGKNNVEEMSQQDLLGFLGHLVEVMHASGSNAGLVHTASEPGSAVGGRPPVRKAGGKGSPGTQT